MRKYPAAPGKDAFLEKLRKLHRDCTSPSYRTLAKISKKLPRLYPDSRGGERDLPQLSAAAISETLRGKRKGLPSAGWVTSFVLSCQWTACQIGRINDDPGLSSLPEWHESLRAAGTTTVGIVKAGPDEHAGGDTLPAPPASLCPPSTVQLTPSQRNLVASYGPHGQTLLERVKAGDPDAVYRVALLLRPDPAHGEEAQPLLLQAAAAFHALAIDLLDANRAGVDRLEAARHACRLASAADAAGSHAEALVYYQCAARAGLPIAIVKFALARLRAHDEHQAAGWLAAIADHVAADMDSDRAQSHTSTLA